MGRIRINLLEVLASRRLKMSDLHRATGIPYSNINNIGNEKVKRIDLTTIARICEALECTPGDLLVYVPDEAGS